jgi:hypothetical protein
VPTPWIGFTKQLQRSFQGTRNQLARSGAAVAIVLGRKPNLIAPSGRAVAAHPRLPITAANFLPSGARWSASVPRRTFLITSSQGMFALNHGPVTARNRLRSEPPG